MKKYNFILKKYAKIIEITDKQRDLPNFLLAIPHTTKFTLYIYKLY